MCLSKRWPTLVFDLLVVASATVLAQALRKNLVFSDEQWAGFVTYLLITIAIAGPILVALQVDRSVWRFSVLADYLRAVVASALIVIVAVALGFTANRLDGVARSLPILQAILMAAGLVGVRVFVRILHDHRGRRGHAKTLSLPAASDTALLIGWGRVAELYLRSVAELGNGTICIAGILATNERLVGRRVLSTRVLGVPDNVRDVLDDLEVHGVSVGRLVVAVPFSQLSGATRQALREIERTADIRVDFLLERLGCEPADQIRPIEQVGGAPGRSGSGPFAFDGDEVEALLRNPYWQLKRFADALLALTMIVLLAPLALGVALVVALDVGLPVLFVQQRPGRRGVPFSLFKFRTMAPSRDRAGNEIPEEGRVSSVGALLRRTRLDELPQLYNILVGDMSFVGPRPLVRRELSSEFVARLLVRPGLTGWAQVRGGRVVSLADKTALDLWYVRNASFKLDLKILAATVPTVLFGERVDMSAVHLAWHDLRNFGPQGEAGDRRHAA
jgi:lipopolysaccharide/colanic/teichoic acid biosynthesis glycosyltransferase